MSTNPNPQDLVSITNLSFPTQPRKGMPFYTPTPDIIQYYEVDPSDNPTRQYLSCALINYGDQGLSNEATVTWFFSFFDCFFPGVTKKMMSGCKTATLAGQRLDENELNFLETGTGNILKLMPGLVRPPTDKLKNTPINVTLGVLISFLFAIAKKPTSLNLAAFTVNRIRAFNERLGGGDELPDALVQDNMPKLNAYVSIHGMFNSMSGIRKRFVNELINWNQMTEPPADVGHVLAVVKLWKYSGMVHVTLIHALINSYPDVLSKINALFPEIRRFLKDYKKIAEGTDDISYSRVIDGDSSTILNSRNYPELLKLASNLARRQDSKFDQYASNIGESRHLGIFVTKAQEINAPLPDELSITIPKDPYT